MDFIFLEFYIKKKYNQKVEEYFNINKVSVSYWRTSNKVPPQRKIEFLEREKSLIPKELLENLY
jgi:hypothetical protein